MMVRTIWNAIKALPRLGERLRNEPIVIMSLAIAAMTAFMQANGDGLNAEDTWLYVGQAIVTWLGRELVYPAAKVESDPTLVVTEPVGQPPMPSFDDD